MQSLKSDIIFEKSSYNAVWENAANTVLVEFWLVFVEFFVLQGVMIP